VFWHRAYHLNFVFFHPDCTVGFGISPNHALRLVGYTTGREFHPALKTIYLIHLIIFISLISVNTFIWKRISKNHLC